MQGFGRNGYAISGFVVGAAVGAGGAYFVLARLKPPSETVTHHALEYGMPRTETLRLNQGYVTAFDYRTRNPKWVLEHITEDSANGNGDRKDVHFFEDKDIEPWLRSRLADFRNSGYDRGHMAPAADHKGSQSAMDETFSMCNISPQVGEGFNRDYWARFEKFVKDITKKSEDVWIVTGPLWMPSLGEDGKWQMKFPLIGQPPALVSVPTHFYKVVLAKGMAKKAGAAPPPADSAVAAFVMPNAPIDPATPLSAFVVPLEPLESVAGTRFFPTYLSKDRVQGLDAVAQEVRSAGLARMKVLDRQQLLESVHPRLALPPSSASLDTLAASRGTQDVASPGSLTVQGSTAEAVITTQSSHGPVRGCAHLCEALACRLPPERFWEQGGTGGNNRSKGRRDSSTNNNKALTRR